MVILYRTIPALAALLVASFAGAQGQTALVKQMGIEQKLGATVPKDATFKDDSGKTIRFGDLLGGRPLLVMPVFYRCQTGCLLVTTNLLKTLSKAAKVPLNSEDHELRVGKDFDVVMLGIHPKETWELAQAKKASILADFKQPATAPGWRLLTGDVKEIRRVTDAIGFRYGYDEQRDMVNHPAAAIFITPEGKVSSYIVGTEFPTIVVQENARIAAQNRVGQKAEEFLFGCIMIDPATGKRTIVYKNVLRLACVITLVVLVGSILRMNQKAKKESASHGA